MTAAMDVCTFWHEWLTVAETVQNVKGRHEELPKAGVVTPVIAALNLIDDFVYHDR